MKTSKIFERGRKTLALAMLGAGLMGGMSSLQAADAMNAPQGSVGVSTNTQGRLSSMVNLSPKEHAELAAAARAYFVAYQHYEQSSRPDFKDVGTALGAIKMEVGNGFVKIAIDEFDEERGLSSDSSGATKRKMTDDEGLERVKLGRAESHKLHTYLDVERKEDTPLIVALHQAMDGVVPFYGSRDEKPGSYSVVSSAIPAAAIAAMKKGVQALLLSDGFSSVFPIQTRVLQRKLGIEPKPAPAEPQKTLKDIGLE